jgi:hypothetical protein
LTADDLRPDPVLIRKIRRLQQAALEESQMDLDDDDDDEEAPPSSQANGSAVRGAGAREASRIPSTQPPPQSSIIEDLGDPSDEEDEE